MKTQISICAISLIILGSVTIYAVKNVLEVSCSIWLDPRKIEATATIADLAALYVIRYENPCRLSPAHQAVVAKFAPDRH